MDIESKGMFAKGMTVERASCRSVAANGCFFLSFFTLSAVLVYGLGCLFFRSCLGLHVLCVVLLGGDYAVLVCIGFSHL